MIGFAQASLFFKSFQIHRSYDPEKNVLIYTVISTKLINGSPFNSISVVPVERAVRSWTSLTLPDVAAPVHVQWRGHAGDRTMLASSYFVNEFWTARQRQAAATHEISYRACFKPQLPAFFIDRLTRARRGRLRSVHGPRHNAVAGGPDGRRPLGNDINPLSPADAAAADPADARR